MNGDRGPRCVCGHYEGEHDAPAYKNLLPADRCTGAYATLAADADDTESVEVHCHCQRFSGVESDYFEVRR